MSETGSTFTVRRRPWLPGSQWTAVGIVIILAIIAAASRLAAQIPPDVGPPHTWQFVAPLKTQEVATETIKRVLPQLVRNDDNHAIEMGFDSAGQVVGAQFPLTLETPFALLRISLARLKALPQTPGHPDDADARQLLLDKANSINDLRLFPARFLFPITIQNNVRSSVLVTFSLRDKRWRLQEVGRPNLIRKLTAAGRGSTHFVVWIPDLNRYYLGRISKDDACDKDNDKFIITAVFSDPVPISLPAGKSRCASEVFALLRAGAVKTSDEEAH